MFSYSNPYRSCTQITSLQLRHKSSSNRTKCHVGRPESGFFASLTVLESYLLGVSWLWVICICFSCCLSCLVRAAKYCPEIDRGDESTSFRHCYYVAWSSHSAIVERIWCGGLPTWPPEGVVRQLAALSLYCTTTMECIMPLLKCYWSESLECKVSFLCYWLSWIQYSLADMREKECPWDYRHSIQAQTQVCEGGSVSLLLSTPQGGLPT